MRKNILFVFALFFSSFVFAETHKIALIDLERAMNEVDEGAYAISALKTEFDAKQEILNKKQDELEKLKAELTKQPNIMRPEAQQAKGMELQRKAAETQQLYFSMQQEMNKRKQEIMGEILQKMHQVSHVLAKESGFDLILNKNDMSVLFAKPAFDLTHEAIRRYNKMHPEKNARKINKKK